MILGQHTQTARNPSALLAAHGKGSY